LLDNLAIGAGLHLGTRVEDPKNSNNKYTRSSWEIMPMITVNLPMSGGWNNTFLQLGAGFGSAKVKTESGSTTTEQKDKTSSYCLWLGYNDFFAKNLAFTPMVGYQWVTDKDSDSGVKQKHRGFDFEMGVRYFF
jgi:hypothetical protein